MSSLKRCVLISFNPVSKLIDLRHYSVTVVPVNLNKGIKKLVTRNIPNMAKFEDVADFITKGYLLSDSEIDDNETHVVLPQNLRRGNLADNKSSLRLQEIGPRLTMRLMKIEEDLLTGEVLYHDYIEKSATEVEELRKKRAMKKRLKEQRKLQQEKNKKRKEMEKIEHKAKTSGGKITDHDRQLLKDAEEAIGNESEEDDSQYYHEAVGEAPDKELFKGQTGSRKRPFIPKGCKFSLNPKKPRMDKKLKHEFDNKSEQRSKVDKSKGKKQKTIRPGKSNKNLLGHYKGKSSYTKRKGEKTGAVKAKFKSGKN